MSKPETPKKTILWVEDQDLQREVYSEEMKSMGYSVLQAGTLEQAQRIIEDYAESLHCMVTDIQIPVGKNGFIEKTIGILTKSGFSSGVYLGQILLRKNPKCGIIGYSAQAPDSEVVDWFFKNGAGYWNKGDMKRGGLAELLEETLARGRSRQIFVLHHDDKTRGELRQYMTESFGAVPMFEELDLGHMNIAKIVEVAMTAQLIFILLASDNQILQATKSAHDLDLHRGIFALGYLASQSDRRNFRVIALHRGGIDLPSGLTDLISIDITYGIAPHHQIIRKELDDLGLL